MDRWELDFNRQSVNWLDFNLLRKLCQWRRVSEREFSAALFTGRFVGDLEQGRLRNVDYPRVRALADYHGVPPWILFAGNSGHNGDLKQLFRDTSTEDDLAVGLDVEVVLRKFEELSNLVELDKQERESLQRLTSVMQERLRQQHSDLTVLDRLKNALKTKKPDRFTRCFHVGEFFSHDMLPVAATLRFSKDTYTYRGKTHDWWSMWLALTGPISACNQVKGVVKQIEGLLDNTELNHWTAQDSIDSPRIKLHSWFYDGFRQGRSEIKKTLEDFVSSLLTNDPVLTMRLVTSLEWNQQRRKTPTEKALIDWLAKDFSKFADVDVSYAGDACGKVPASSQASKLRGTADVLLDSARLRHGDHLVLKHGRCKSLFKSGDARFYGVFEFHDRPYIRWLADGRLYTLTDITMRVLRDAGLITGSSRARVNGFDCWGLDDSSDMSLYQMAKHLIQEN